MEVRSVGFTLLATAAAFGAAIAGTRFGGLAADFFEPAPEPSDVRIRGCEVADIVARSEALFLDQMPEGSRKSYLLYLDVTPPTYVDNTVVEESITVSFPLALIYDEQGRRQISQRNRVASEIRFDPNSCDLLSWEFVR